jgi:Fur family transcriptional regulator, ferric uptake regulator
MKKRPHMNQMVSSSWTPDFMRQLHEKGERITLVRTGLIDVIAKTKKPISVSEILETLAKRDLTVNKTTLYRDLRCFKKLGFITEIQLNERQVRYELAELDHHHHLVCTSCNRIEDVELKEDLDKQERVIEKQTKFKIQRHALEFFGLCHTCQTA